MKRTIILITLLCFLFVPATFAKKLEDVTTEDIANAPWNIATKIVEGTTFIVKEGTPFVIKTTINVLTAPFRFFESIADTY